MSTSKTNFVLEKIKIGEQVQNIVARSTGDYTTVNYNGQEVTLSSALTSILSKLSQQNTDSTVDEKISAAISELVGGAPETYDTLKEIADYIAEHEDVAEALNEAIGNKVDKAEGASLMSQEDKTRLDGLRGVRYGSEVPSDLKDGELFVHVVEETV